MDVTSCATQKSSLPSCILSRVFLFCLIILLLFYMGLGAWHCGFGRCGIWFFDFQISVLILFVVPHPIVG